jgi:molecular chaperone DnaK (HSP70)
VLEEPTAAAVAYKLHKKSNIHHILVYDFGGGTLDVSLLFVSKGSVQVYATDGDEHLGGSDLDLCMYDIIKEKVGR